MSSQFEMLIARMGNEHATLWLHTSEDPDQEAWDDAMKRIRQYGLEQGVRPNMMRHLVLTDGGAPNARQRAQLKETFGDGRIQFAIVTTVLTNPVKRGVATALQWVNPSYGFFQPSEFYRALTHIGLTEYVDAIWLQYRRLQVKLPQVQVTRTVAEVTGLPALM